MRNRVNNKEAWTKPVLVIANELGGYDLICDKNQFLYGYFIWVLYMGILYHWNYFISLKHFWKELRPVIVIQSFKGAKNAALEEAKNFEFWTHILKTFS